jgi:hypothetical protein
VVHKQGATRGNIDRAVFHAQDLAPSAHVDGVIGCNNKIALAFIFTDGRSVPD